MRTTPPIAAFLLLASLGSVARADDTADAGPTSPTRAPGERRSGLTLGLGTGYALPFGSLYDAGNRNLRDALMGSVPLRIDFGYRVSRAFYVGAHAELGLVLANTNSSDCGSGATCSGEQARIGLDVQYHVSPEAGFDPWVGLGFGYEGLSHKVVGSAKGDFTRTLRGYELVNLQLGADLKLGSAVALGPFVGFSLGQFGYVFEYQRTAAGITTPRNGEIDGPSMHEWLTLGVRGTYAL